MIHILVKDHYGKEEALVLLRNMITIILKCFLKLIKKDIIFHLGDFIFDTKDPKEFEKYLNFFKKIPAKIKLIPGNHDSILLYKQDVIEIMPPLVNYKGNWLSHCPIHPAEFRERYLNIHGHNHINHLKDQRYFNVNIDLWNRFVSYDEIMERKTKIQSGCYGL